MKKLIAIGVMFGVVSAFTSNAAAQGAGGMIAYDACYPVYWSGDIWDWTLTCDSYLASPDAPNNAHVGGGIDPAASPDGARIALVEDAGMVVVNLSDWSRTIISSPGASPAWSPDGTKLAVSGGELYVIHADGSGVTQLTNNLGSVGYPAWSPDGLAIAFDCELEGGNRDICAINADGTGFVRLTSDPTWDSGPAFSPDGLTIAFASARYGMGSQVVLMNPDGTGVRRVGAGVIGYQPAWSPDGSRIAFAVSSGGGACEADGRYCDFSDTIFVMNADGSEQRPVARGNHPSWALSPRPIASFISWCDRVTLTCTLNGSSSWVGNGNATYTWTFGDGTSDTGPTQTHAYSVAATYTATLTVTNDLGDVGTQTRILDVAPYVAPTASFTVACIERRCTFDGSGSSAPYGSLSYSWSFGDGDTSSGYAVTSHAYTADGAFTVSLTVTDVSGGTATHQQMVTVTSAPPTALFTAACTALTCSVNASQSSDDGMIASYTWNFGDGTTGSGVTANHTYSATGTYSIVLTVVDTTGASATHAASVSVASPDIHVGDLDRIITTQQNTWSAAITIAVHNSSHGALPNSAVSGSWSDGSPGECLTTATGKCTVSRSGISKKTRSVSFSVISVAQSSSVHAPSANHDDDGDSNGTTITVIRP